MKVNLKDILANPFRNIKEYPIDKEKVERLKESMDKTSFWDNILLRPHPTKKNKYQLAYGHHRIYALKSLKITTIDVPVKPLSDIQMLQIMADENVELKHSPAVMMETIAAVKAYMQKVLSQSPTLEDFQKTELYKFIQFNNKQTFNAAKGKKGIGISLILRFLNGGKPQGSWKQSEIQFSLNSLNAIEAGDIDKEAIEQFDNRYQAEEFSRAVRHKYISKDRQKKVAQETVKTLKKKKKSIAESGRRAIRNIVDDITTPKEKKPEIDPNIEKAIALIDQIKINSKKLLHNIIDINQLMREMDIITLKGLKVNEAVNSLTNLINEIKHLQEGDSEAE